MHFFRHMGVLFNIQSRQQRFLLLNTRVDYHKSLSVIEKRITGYFTKLKELKTDEVYIHDLESKFKKIQY